MKIESRYRTRIEYLDALKGVSILLVVFCHFVVLPSDSIIGNFFMTAAWSAVPCFMMTSGALMHQGSSFNWKKYFNKIAKTYSVLCTWRLIYLVVQCVLKDLHFEIVEMIQYLFFLMDLDGVNTGVMWYMLAFLVVLLFYPVTFFLFKGNSQGSGHKVLMFVVIVSAIGGLIIPSVNWVLKYICPSIDGVSISISGLNRVLPYTNYANMLFYFLAGAFIFEYRDLIHAKIRRFRTWLIPLVFVSICGLMIIKYIEIDSFQWEGQYISGGYNHIMTAVISIGLFLLFMEYEKEMKWLNHFFALFIGQYTMGIYYLHYIILIVASILLYPNLINYYSCSLNFIKIIVVTVVCVVITILFRKIPYIKYLVQ